MLKYAIVVDNITKQCNVGLGTNTAFYKSIGMSEMEVEQGVDGNWYLQRYVPAPNLDELKTEKLTQVQAWTQTAITGGFTSDCAGIQAQFDSDVDTQVTMQGIALNVNTEQFTVEYPQGCPVRGYEVGSDTKTVLLLEPTQVLQFCADLSKHIGQQKQRGWELQQAVSVATTAEELSAITW